MPLNYFCQQAELLTLNLFAKKRQCYLQSTRWAPKSSCLKQTCTKKALPATEHLVTAHLGKQTDFKTLLGHKTKLTWIKLHILKTAGCLGFEIYWLLQPFLEHEPCYQPPSSIQEWKTKQSRPYFKITINISAWCFHKYHTCPKYILNTCQQHISNPRVLENSSHTLKNKRFWGDTRAHKMILVLCVRSILQMLICSQENTEKLALYFLYKMRPLLWTTIIFNNQL